MLDDEVSDEGDSDLRIAWSGLFSDAKLRVRAKKSARPEPLALELAHYLDTSPKTIHDRLWHYSLLISFRHADFLARPLTSSSRRDPFEPTGISLRIVVQFGSISRHQVSSFEQAQKPVRG